MTPLRVRIGILGLALLAGLAAPATASAAGDPAGAGSTAQPPTTEELRLDRAAPQEILRRSGFDRVAPEFARALARAGSYAEAERIVARDGWRLWRRAVDRAQGRGPAGGDLSRDDDRPLYWARLGMTRELRDWEPRFSLTKARRAGLLELLERGSRGQDSIRHEHPKGGKGVKRVLLTGFDPFTLDRDVRISNPSGATALALDGTTVRTPDGALARVETAVFPVRWDDFADGTVERTLRPHLRGLDLLTTVSQGRVGRIDIERTNGAWRGGFGDNENLSRTGLVPVTDPASQPQWTTTTLPYARIVAAATGRFPGAAAWRGRRSRWTGSPRRPRPARPSRASGRPAGSRAWSRPPGSRSRPCCRTTTGSGCTTGCPPGTCTPRCSSSGRATPTPGRAR